MKKLLLVTLLASVWSVSATANEVGNDYWLSKGAYQVAANDADEVDTHKRLRLNFISKRPYQHKVDKQEKWEGATLKNESIDEDGEVKSKSNINQFSRRPYMKRNVD
jgi:hypothetical protein